MTAPMTAAEYREVAPGIKELTPFGKRTLAALEEREALLGERGIFAEDAALGALVRRIREHPMVEGAALTIRTKSAKYGGDASLLFDSSLTKALSRLDSLLPKEPEVAPSGWRYERVSVRNGQPCIVQCREGGVELTCFGGHDDVIPPIDREFVHKLMEASRGN